MKIVSVIPSITTLMIFIVSLGYSQQTVYNNSLNVEYRSAIELYNQENYGSAITAFDLFMKKTTNTKGAIYEDAAYYSTVCAVKLKQKDAENRVEKFASDFPSSAWIPEINFELGNIYFKEKKYSKALNTYNGISVSKLDYEQLNEYYYKKGYCQMKQSKFDYALKSFENILNSNSSYQKPASYYYANIQYQKGNYNEALIGFKAIAGDSRYKKYVPFYLLNIYYQIGDYLNVIEEGDNYISKVPRRQKGNMARLMANAYYNHGKYAKAYEYFVIYESSTRKNDDPTEQYRIGYCKYLREEFRSAIVNLQNATKAGGAIEQSSWYYLGFCYLYSNQPKFAQSSFLKAFKNNTNIDIAADALFNYMKITIQIGTDSFNDPVLIIENYIDQNPSSQYIAKSYDLLSQLYLSSKNYPAALQSIEKVNNPNQRVQTVYQQLAYAQGIDNLKKRAYSDALIYFEKSLKFPVNNKIESEAIFWSGDAYYHLKKYDKASIQFNKFLRSKGSSETSLEVSAEYNIAYCSFNSKQYERAIMDFERLLQNNITDKKMITDVYLRMADCYLITNNYNTAIVWFNKVINNRSTSTDYALYQKALCFGSQGDFNKKISTLTQLINGYKSSSYYDEALYDLASTNLILNNQRDAIIYFDKLIKEKPKSSYTKKALVKMGSIYYNNNQYDQAVKPLRKIIDTYPASLEAKEALITLQNVYMDMGQVDTYINYANSLDFVQVSTSEQDSLNFVVGENYFVSNDCENSVAALRNYVEEYPSGGFVLTAYNYLTECLERMNNNTDALVYHEKIIEFPENQFTSKSLLKLARTSYDEERYDKSLIYYDRLSELTDSKVLLAEARDGVMKSAWKTNNAKQAKYAAQQLIISDKASDNQIIYAHYILGSIALEENKLVAALNEFDIVSKLSREELGAESQYNVSLIEYKNNNLNSAEEEVYKIPENYPGYNYWIAKGFILLADIYVGRENYFQAEQTLISVIDNYSGEDLKEVAQGKLDRLKVMELESEEVNDNQ
jgi:TolA-binding protein